jgi:uncharacterized protein (DUF362 family)
MIDREEGIIQMFFSRRHFIHAAGAGLILSHTRLLKAQEPPALATAPTVKEFPGRSRVALMHGESRRKNACDALTAIDAQIRPRLQQKKYAVIKPNIVNTENQLASTHADALRGIMDYLAPRFRGPVYIAESSAGDTLTGYENFHYADVAKEFGSQVKLVDLNREAKYETIPLIDFDLHLEPVRLAARLLDPDAFVICSGIMKTHNAVVVTLSVKNMVLGAPLHSVPGEKPWNDKRKYHVGVRQNHYNMLLTAQKLQPNWGVTMIDGHEGMEGNGPNSGTPVPSRIAIASTDYIAADRVAVEAMGVNPGWVGYLEYCGQVGLGNYSLNKIDLEGASLASVKRKYRLHADIDRELQWMGPMEDLPPKLGYRRDDSGKEYS